MAWTLENHQPSEDILLDNYFLAVGKALCIASNFEHKCKFILQTMTLVEARDAGHDFDAARELVKALDKKVLNETINRIGNHPAFSAADIEILRAAKDSRNYIAHESAAMGSLNHVRAKVIEAQFAVLLDHAELVAKGDNLVSKWCYEICEKEPAPRVTHEEYGRMVREWVGRRTWEWGIEVVEPKG